MGDHIEEEEERQCLSVTATPCWSCCFLNFFQDEKRQKCSCLLSSISHYPADLSKRSLVHNSFLPLCKLSPRDDLILQSLDSAGLFPQLFCLLLLGSWQA